MATPTYFVQYAADGTIYYMEVKGDTLELLQNLVGGYIQEVPAPRALRKEWREGFEVALWADEEGSFKYAKRNAFFKDIFGDTVLSLVNEDGESCGFTLAEISKFPVPYKM